MSTKIDSIRVFVLLAHIYNRDKGATVVYNRTLLNNILQSCGMKPADFECSNLEALRVKLEQ